MSQTETTPVKADLDAACINTIRTLSMDAVERAQSGHPGTPMGAAPMAFVLWTKFLKHDPADTEWIDRDRFVLSAGHASMLLYSLLHLTGYNLTLEDIRSFRQWGSKTPGHPEFRMVPGAETTTGPLGQGFANGIGMAMAERFLADRYNRPGLDVVDHYVYAICSDGDLMEGVASEAASLAGHLRLNKLVYLYDANQISIDGSTDLAFSEDVGSRFKAYGWHVSTVEDGNDLVALEDAISAARSDERPSLVVVKTHIGYGAPTKQDTAGAHGAPLGEDEIRAAKEFLGWDPDAEFLVPDEVREHFVGSTDRGAIERAAWLEKLDRYRGEHPEEGADFDRISKGDLPQGWDDDLPRFTPDDGKLATRKASGKALNAVAEAIPELVGGSADLMESNNTEIEGAEIFRPGQAGRYIHFGVREHAMGAAVNGLGLHGGVRAFGATFLIFSDYMKPTIRLAGLMELPSIFLFTHDSIGLGEDGPTHQPIEHLAGLRAIPNLKVIRPGDANETVEAWRFAIGHREGPVALCLSRQGLPVLQETSEQRPAVERGAYILHESGDGSPDIILIGTGSEVHVIREAADLLAQSDVAARVVSMPCMELFQEQPESYRHDVIPPTVTVRLAVEAASPLGWHRWIGPSGDVVTIDRFGASAPGDRVLSEFGFTPENVARRSLQLLESDGGETS